MNFLSPSSQPSPIKGEGVRHAGGCQAFLLWILVSVCVPSSFAWAQAAVDPLRRPEEPSGQYTWRVSLGYAPSGREGFGVDEFGQPYAYTLFSQEWRLSLAGTVQVGTGWKTSLEISDQTTTIEEVRRYPGGEVRLASTHQAFAYAMAHEYRMDPKNPWDPRVSLALGHPWRAGVGVAVSLLRDPMVLVGEVGLRSQEEEPQGWLTLGLGAGFVANAWISLSASVSLAVPVLGVGVPAATLGLRLRYSLDRQDRKEVGVRASLGLRGNRTWLALEVEVAGRGP